MEKKKYDRYDLDKKSPLFFSIGLIIALLCVTVAFEWRSQYDPLQLEPRTDEVEPMIDIPITDFPVPEPPKPEVKKEELTKPAQIKDVVAVDNTEELKQLFEPTEGIPIEDVKLDLPPVEPEETDKIHLSVENMPEFPGGLSAFYKYVSENVDYPIREKRLGISGKVYVQFVINPNGELTDITILKGVSEGLDKEAIEVLENSPKWIPGKQRGRPVKVRMALPIQFTLNY